MIWDLLGKIAIVLGILVSLFGVGGWLANKHLAFIKWIQNRHLLKKRQRVGETPYLNGLVKLLPREKNILLNEALRADKYEEAVVKFKLLLSQAINDGERCAFLSLIGINQARSGSTREAEETFLEMIRIAEEANLREALPSAYANLGMLYQVRGDADRAVDFSQRSLKLADEMYNTKVKIAVLINIGNVYLRIFNRPQQALKAYEGSLELIQQVDDRVNKAYALGNIGVAYQMMGNLERALELFQQTLGLTKGVKNLKEVYANALAGIGNIWRARGNPQKALDYHERSLRVNEEIGNPLGRAEALHNIGTIYADLGRVEEALAYFQDARTLSVQIGAQHLTEQADKNIAIAKQELKKQRENK